MAPAVCLGGLGVAIAPGFVRADLLAAGAPLHVLLTAAVEVALVGLLSFHVVGLGRRLRRIAVLRGVGKRAPLDRFYLPLAALVLAAAIVRVIAMTRRNRRRVAFSTTAR